jgi:PIN domain nuclease of toxin-antitoxin system
VTPVLLDTCALLWWVLEPQRLSRRAHDRIADTATPVYVSAASVTEMAVKASRGHLHLPGTVRDTVERLCRDEGFVPIAVEHRHASALQHLPRHHADPFDRLLIATAIVEGFAIATNDPWFGRYGVEVVW